jgi:hypothetical protein
MRLEKKYPALDSVQKLHGRIGKILCPAGATRQSANSAKPHGEYKRLQNGED